MRRHERQIKTAFLVASVLAVQLHGELAPSRSSHPHLSDRWLSRLGLMAKKNIVGLFTSMDGSRWLDDGSAKPTTTFGGVGAMNAD